MMFFFEDVLRNPDEYVDDILDNGFIDFNDGLKLLLDFQQVLIMPGVFEFHGSLFDLFALACNRQQIYGFNVNGCHSSVPFLYVSSDFDCSLE